MAVNLPDVDLSTLASSDQIFSTPITGASHASYTLPQIRALHKQIHLAIDDKKARLRTQVGGSYRELLGTADAIVKMRGDMDVVQGTLGTMGARCGRGVVGSKVGGLAKFVGDRSGVVEGDSGKMNLGQAARNKILAGCVLALARLLKDLKKDETVDGDLLVVAAKVSVLGRLLTKTFETDQPDPGLKAVFTSSAQSLEKLRRRLRRSIDRMLENVGLVTNRGLVLKALCAHSLATNSGAREVIRHFLGVRGNAMASVFDLEEQRSHLDVVKGLGLYTKTILDVQFLVPNKLSEALFSLKKELLLSDASLRELEGLRVDIYERWCGETVKNFKPSVRHDDLDGKQAVDMLHSWSSKGSEVLLAGLEKTLDRTTEFKALTDMRTEVLQLWIRDGGKIRGLDPSVMQDKLRLTINARVMSVLDAKVHKLRLVGSEVAATLEVWHAGADAARQDLWDVASLDMDLQRGAGSFAQDVICRLYGRNDAVARAVTGYKSWAQVIDDVESVVDQLKRQRWDNDVDEIEDEETINQRQQALSRDDPTKLQERLDLALEKAFGELDKQLSELWDANKDGESSGQIAIYLLRILRDIRARLPKLATVKGFGLQVVPSLQENLASVVIVSPLDDFVNHALAKKTVVGRNLWEGDPELPTSPSPAIFKLLRKLTMAMSDAGTDLWSPVAVSVLKERFNKHLSGRWVEVLDNLVPASESAVEQVKMTSKEESIAEQKEESSAAEHSDSAEEEKAPAEGEKETVDGDQEQEQVSQETVQEDGQEDKNEAETSAASQKTEGTEQAAAAEKANRDLLVQWLFDVAILRCCMGNPDAADELKKVEEAIWDKAELDGGPARQRLHKTSQEYWKRSSLLFGLLA